ncbi:MAG: C40 family peptidase [Gemmatimonadaceae bacterium]
MGFPDSPTGREMTVVTVHAAIAPMQARPAAHSEQVSQTLAGHRLTVLETQEPWLRVRSRDDYEGWIHRGFLDADHAASYARERTSLGCVLREGSTERRLPLGAIIADDATIASGEAIEALELSQRFPRTGEAIVRSARELYAGTPYQWGGITPWGADCSGLVQTIFGLHGVAFPRDASQQAETARAIDGALESLEPADLLFFSDRPDRRVTHVAISLGGPRVVHLALGRGGYRVEDLTDSSDDYVKALRERYRFARRAL